MKLASKLSALNQIYKVYDDFIDTLDIACQKKCALCCTDKVTLTTLEGYRIIDFILSNEARLLFERFHASTAEKRFRPRTTINTLADLSAAGKQFPDEKDVLPQQICPLLTENLCPVYPSRPFACRCLVSRRVCRKNGYAELDEFVLSVNTVFLQAIEHLDADGFSGNLADMMNCLESKDNRSGYRQGRLKTASKWKLIHNRPLKVLMIPPEYRKKIQPVWQSLQRIKIG